MRGPSIVSARREKRLQEEASRQSRTVDQVRAQLVDQGLDRIERAVALRADVLLVTVTSTETEELERAAMDLTGEKVKRLSGQAGRYRILGEIGGQRVSAIRLREQGSYSPRGSAFTCYGARAETSATSLIGIGTAYGVDKISQQFGDVLVSTSLALYDEAAVREGASPDSYEYHYEERARALASAGWIDRFRMLQDDKWAPSNTASFWFGTLLAGSTHIESEAFRNELVERVQRIPSDYDPVVGGEMEAAGLAAVGKSGSVEWIVVKGISDFATPASRAQIEETRVTAARNAARSVLRALTLTPSMA